MKTIKLTKQDWWNASKHSIVKSKKVYTRKAKHKKKL